MIHRIGVIAVIQLREIMTPVTDYLSQASTLEQAITIMKRKKWNIVPVTDQDGRLRGVFTRSILYQMVLAGHPLHTPIHPFMKKDVVAFSVDTPYDIIEKVVENSNVGSGVVLDSEQRPIGLITSIDIARTLLLTSYSLREQLEAILATSQLGAVMTDEQNRVIFVNARFCDMLGCVEKQIIGCNIKDVIPDIHTTEVQEMEQEVHQRIAVGNYRTIVRLSKYKTVKGQEGFIALFQNISEVERMAEELESVKRWKSMLQTVIDKAYDGIVMINQQGRISFVSPSLIELFELDESRTIHQAIDGVLPQLGLTRVIKSGLADISDFMEVNGIQYIVHRIPVLQDQHVVGAIGKIMFRQLQEVRERFKRFDRHEGKDSMTRQQRRQTESSRFTFDEIITGDYQMEKLVHSVSKAAKGRSTILIRGESGTGKELFAHAIHSISPREEKPFVTVNCAAIPEHLLESEFFGYEEGAFTGAKHKGKVGKFDLAHGGTLFLDEVGDMSLPLQAKLLRVLQEGEFYRVGGTDRIHVDVRIISATNRPLEDMVEKGTFREDLFYRLNVISFEIPPLRLRKGDILLLCELFIKDLNKSNGTSVTSIDAEAQRVMLEYEWPGNVRELRNVLERAMVFAESGKIQLADLPDYVLKKASLPSSQLPVLQHNLLNKAEQDTIQMALQKTNGNKSQAARLLGISRSVLYEKLKKYQINCL
ncbi:sigma 54-interacting transcriptional regulator [Aneurinibacillus uraniidurans]|uniref:sigma 54-interacting transcriptional regulator n=1 Tax=Aneurinibacillus uraniidurans TaxID=2966586 RepID=UPI00234BFFBC|nr:sigma 54-interacting transcriptional regulator [Aneurinibacillus sp. B1]WCN39223.1 sigma 54-interacting transcriptional regulator [Aneurinibacillus sp. B1]